MKSASGTLNYSAPRRVCQSKDQSKACYNKISRDYDLLSDRSEAPMRKAGLKFLSARAGENVLKNGFRHPQANLRDEADGYSMLSQPFLAMLRLSGFGSMGPKQHAGETSSDRAKRCDLKTAVE